MAPHKLTKKQLAEQRARQHVQREASTDYQNPNQVMTKRQTAAREGVSIATLNRQIAAGSGPRLVQLSARRVGIRVLDYIAWQESRMRGAV